MLLQNLELGVIDHLNEGIPTLQGQTHYDAATNTISYCHTSYDLLDVGTAETYFKSITRWIRTHPHDVVTILIGNSDFIIVGNYTKPRQLRAVKLRLRPISSTDDHLLLAYTFQHHSNRQAGRNIHGLQLLNPGSAIFVF